MLGPGQDGQGQGADAPRMRRHISFTGFTRHGPEPGPQAKAGDTEWIRPSLVTLLGFPSLLPTNSYSSLKTLLRLRSSPVFPPAAGGLLSLLPTPPWPVVTSVSAALGEAGTAWVVSRAPGRASGLLARRPPSLACCVTVGLRLVWDEGRDKVLLQCLPA